MNINELMIKKENELTTKQLSFLEVHTNIMTSGNVISNALLTLAKNLKRMKDEELFLEAGYSSFEEYSEQACGLKRRQAYNYIKVLDNLGENFVHSNAQIGISKLSLLTTLSDNEKTEILGKVDIEDISVTELKQEITSLKEEKDKLEIKSKEKISQLKLELDKLKNAPREKEIVDNPELLKKIETLENFLKSKENVIASKDRKISEFEKQLSVQNSSSLTEFKILFENLQVLINQIQTIIPLLPEEKQEGCKNALKAVMEGLC